MRGCRAALLSRSVPSRMSPQAPQQGGDQAAGVVVAPHLGAATRLAENDADRDREKTGEEDARLLVQSKRSRWTRRLYNGRCHRRSSRLEPMSGSPRREGRLREAAPSSALKITSASIAGQDAARPLALPVGPGCSRRKRLAQRRSARRPGPVFRKGQDAKWAFAAFRRMVVQRGTSATRREGWMR